MTTYVTRPTLVQAEQWTTGIETRPPAPATLVRWVNDVPNPKRGDVGGHWELRTLNGWVQLEPMDYIVQSIAGDFYPVKPAVFEVTHEAVAP